MRLPWTILLLLLALLASVWFYVPTEDFSLDNPSWNGLSRLGQQYPVERLTQLSSALPGGSLLLLIPRRELSPEELGSLSALLQRGGTLVIADETGLANPVTEALGLGPRFATGLLRDPLLSYRSSPFPLVRRFALPLEEGLSLVLNYATALTETPPDQAVALSSSFSFLDRDGDNVWDPPEPLGPLPVAAAFPWRGGRVVLVSDSSLFTNWSLSRKDNRRFVELLLSPERGARIFVYAEGEGYGAVAQAQKALGTLRRSLFTPAGLLGIAAVALGVALLPLWGRREPG